MSAFPGPGANIIRNEAGEVLGWDYPSYEDEGFFDFDEDFRHRYDMSDDEFYDVDSDHD